jgi:NADPH:quinone reductase-like Zn-dependent oxidoreductase
MKAVIYHNYGTAETLKLAGLQKPYPKENEVLVKVYAASVNSWDWDLLRGRPFLVRIGGFRKPKFNTLGADVAGVVESVGEKVVLFEPGDMVYGDLSAASWGGFAEYVCAPENALMIKPATMTFEQAAAVPQAGGLAIQALQYKGDLKKGQTVLINGAGGGVGSFAIQIAKSFGAEVTGVDSEVKLHTEAKI